MYNVVIVDDEEIIANGLKTILPWDQYKCQVVGMAYDGEEGLALIRKTRSGYSIHGYPDARHGWSLYDRCTEK